jgi:hypothetical protein
LESTSLQPISSTSSPPPAAASEPIQIGMPTLKPTLSPQNLPLEVEKTEIPSVSTSIVGTGVTETPTIPMRGTMYFGNVTFTISNSARLDADHLKSGKTRHELSLAFRNLTETISEGILNQSSMRSLYFRANNVKRNLLSSLVEADIDQIQNATCPNDVPPDTLCAECYAMFAVQSDESQSTIVQSQVDTLQSNLQAAITDGKLQVSLDAIDPDTPVRIEEGTVRLRGIPSGIFTLSTMNVTSMAGIGGGLAIVTLFLMCIGMKYCTRSTGNKQKSSSIRSSSQSVEKPTNKKSSGVFG